MLANLSYRYRGRWGERVNYGLVQLSLLSLAIVAFAYVNKHARSDSLLPPPLYLVTFALWLIVASSLKNNRESLLAYRRLIDEHHSSAA